MEKDFGSQNTAQKRFARFAWFFVAYNILIVVWGAFVRASKSGDGCGTSYPLCNGMIVPHAAEIKTIVEFSHRVSSGLALILVVVLLVWAFRVFPKKHLVRYGAVFSLIFLLIEAAIGAALVLLRLVAHNDSIERAFSMSAHLVNTFVLLAVLAITAWWASGGRALVLKGNQLLATLFGATLAGFILVGVSGAIAALGDTLFPASSLAEGINQDFSETAHFLIRLRILHPILSVTIGFFAAMLAVWTARRERENTTAKKLALAVVGLVVVQLIAGAVNVLLLVPIWMQLLHLLLADLLWLSIVLLAAAKLSQPSEVLIAGDLKPAFETAKV
jgi:heme a synthase